MELNGEMFFLFLNQEEKNNILQQSEDYTKRKSINLIGVNKQKTGDSKPRFYDIENFTFNYSYNQIEHRDYEIESMLDQNVRAGASYNFNFNSAKLVPFKNNDSLFTGKYFKILKDFNLNLLPSNLSIKPELDNFDYTKEQSEEGYKNFTVIQCKIKSIEWLYLAAKGHRRAKFNLENNKDTWLVP